MIIADPGGGRAAWDQKLSQFEHRGEDGDEELPSARLAHVAEACQFGDT